MNLLIGFLTLLTVIVEYWTICWAPGVTDCTGTPGWVTTVPPGRASTAPPRFGWRVRGWGNRLVSRFTPGIWGSPKSPPPRKSPPISHWMSRDPSKLNPPSHSKAKHHQKKKKKQLLFAKTVGTYWHQRESHALTVQDLLRLRINSSASYSSRVHDSGIICNAHSWKYYLKNLSLYLPSAKSLGSSLCFFCTYKAKWNHFTANFFTLLHLLCCVQNGYFKHDTLALFQARAWSNKDKQRNQL